MEAKYVVPNIAMALQKKEYPSIVLWNRVEGRPRTHNFDRALKAEIRDALWMLTKQWQMGEFNGDDAGSPVFAKAHLSTTALTKYKAGDQSPQQYEENVPLEAKVEQRKISFERKGKAISLDIRLQMGHQWLKMAEAAVPGTSAEYIRNYPFELPAKTQDADHIYAHTEVWQQYAAVSGRCMDGYLLYKHIAENAGSASDNINPPLAGVQKTAIDDAGKSFVSWFKSLYYQPINEKNNAWKPSNLEYEFSCSTPDNGKEKVFSADEYYHGHLDWYTFNIDHASDDLGAIDGFVQPAVKNTFTNTFIPSSVQFEGMPNVRWWAFEDGKTSFGDVKPSTTDIAKLLLMEFALVYANDWYMIPFTIPIGSIAQVEGLSVTNTFGEKFWIKPATQNTSDNTRDWSMFMIDPEDSRRRKRPDNSLLLAPTAIKVQEGEPLEDIRLIRDEMANMVWSIESVVMAATGKPQQGKESGQALFNYHRQFIQDKLRIEKEATLLIADIDAMAIALTPPVDQAKIMLQDILTALTQPVIDVDKQKENLEAAKELLRGENALVIHEIDISTVPLPYAANISYLAMTSVPEHWIPFVPVHIKGGDNREIQLQRAAMLRIVEGDKERPLKIEPQTSLLREGMDENPKRAYYIFEEEVLRTGTRITQTFQRTRWTNGEVFVWLSDQKKTGRGEGSSGLAFDQVVDVKI